MDIGLVNDKVKITSFFLHHALLVAIKYKMVIQKDLFFARAAVQGVPTYRGVYPCEVEEDSE